MSHEEIYCLLIPLKDERLLVPRACLSEVVNYQRPKPMEGTPPWYLGTVSWDDKRLPLVSFEAACGRNVPEPGGRGRIAVMQAITSESGGGHFALLVQGFPQLVRVSADVVHTDDSRVFGERSPVICQVRMVNEYPLVPDFEMLEKMIVEETRAD